MEDLLLRRPEGRWGAQVTYDLHYPATAAGNTPFDRWWRQQAEAVRRTAARERGHFPTRYAAEWQETRRDGRFCSGFLDVSRCIGHGDWTLWRISATFTKKSPHPLTLRQLLSCDWQTALQPMIFRKLEGLSMGETPFFRNWRRRCRPGGYYLTPEGLCLWFPQEQLGPKNAGLPTILLPYDSLDILRRLC